MSRRRRCPPLDVGPPIASRGRGGPCRRGDGLPGLSWTRPTTYGRGVPARPAQGSSTPRCGRAPPTCIAAPLGVIEKFCFRCSRVSRRAAGEGCAC